MEEGRVSAETQVADNENAKYFQIEVVVLVGGVFNNQCENGQRSGSNPERALGPDYHD